MTRQEILQKAIDTYGSVRQTDKCIEELSELTQALQKARYAYVGAELKAACEHVREEIADVQIMLDQMRLIYGDTAEQEAYKLERLEKRMEGDKKIQPIFYNCRCGCVVSDLIVSCPECGKRLEGAK